MAELGRRLLLGPEDQTPALEVLGENVENSCRKVVIRKARAGYHAYREMLHYYAVKNLLDYLAADPAATLDSMAEELAGPRERHWVNLGGQLAPAPEVERLLAGIKAGDYRSWPEIHLAYDILWSLYPLQKQRHAFATLLELLGTETSSAGATTTPVSRSGRGAGSEEALRSGQDLVVGSSLSAEAWDAALDEAVRIQQYVCDQVFLTREKDYRNHFRQSTFRNAAEMRAVVGTAEDNSFVKLVRHQTEEFRRLVQTVKARPHGQTHGAALQTR